MITADLDRALAGALRSAGAGLPFTAGTWRPAPGGSYATSLALQLAGLAGCRPRDLAAALAGPLAALPWVSGARPSGTGYLTVDVLPQAVAASAAAMAAAGPVCAASTILDGTETAVRPWPDLAAQPGWPEAWQAQAEAMTGRLAAAAGARVTTSSGEEPARPADALTAPRAEMAGAVAYFGADAVRYCLARTLPGSAVLLAGQQDRAALSWPGQRGAGQRGAGQSGAGLSGAGQFGGVQQAHAEAASTLRWAADLGIARGAPDERLASLLAAPAERALLGLLSFLPVRVAAAARRHRPGELPRYLERVGEAWLECRRVSPALPFGGQAAAREPAVVWARLLLADAARAVLAAGLGLTGIAAADRM